MLLISGHSMEILLCSNCTDAFQYVEEVSFVYKDENDIYCGFYDIDDDKSALINFQEKLTDSNQEITICFDMYHRDKKYYLVDMPFLYRLFILKTDRKNK